MSIDHSTWSLETKAAYLACAIDTDGWVSCRVLEHKDGHYRIGASVGVTNVSVDFLHRFADCANVPRRYTANGKVGRDSRGIVTRATVWQSYWRSPLHVISILEMALPYLLAKKERAEWTLEFCKSRITKNGKVDRKHSPYTHRSFELARFVTLANGKAETVYEIPDYLL